MFTPSRTGPSPTPVGEGLPFLEGISVGAGDRPKIRKTVFCTGDIKTPSLLEVPIGTPLGELVDLCGMSRFELVDGDHLAVEILDLRSEPRCERSWKRDGTVRERSDGGMLSQRDAEVVGVG